MTVCNGTLFTVEKISSRAGIELGTAKSVGAALNPLSYRGSCRGWGGPHSIGLRRAILDAAKGGCWFSAGCPRHTWLFINSYILRLPKAGRLHPSSKSGPDMIISCGDLRLVVSTRHRKVVQNPHFILSLSDWWPCGSVGWCSKDCTRTLTIYGVARGLVGGPAARWGGIPKSCTRTPTLYTTVEEVNLLDKIVLAYCRADFFSWTIFQVHWLKKYTKKQTVKGG